MDTPDFFVGARLGAARLKAGISLEKAAKDTRIRVQKLREIEADDFSGFAHPTYSRLFLLDYADYLGVPQDEIRPLLPDRAGAAGAGFQYIEQLSLQPSSPVVPMRRKRRSILWPIAILSLCLFVAIAGLLVYFTLKKIERVTGSGAISAITPPQAEPQETPTPEATPVSQPSPEEDIPAMLDSAQAKVPLTLNPTSAKPPEFPKKEQTRP
jgi:cytoskeletal protein RodZ